MPRWCATTAPGLGEIVREELASVDAKLCRLPFAGRGLVGFDVPSHEAGRALVHELRTVDRIGPVLDAGTVDTEDPFDELAAMAKQVAWSPWIDERTRWGLRVSRYGEHPFGSPDVERRLGGHLDAHLTGTLPSRPPVDLEDPDAQVRLHLDDEGGAVLWLDLVGPESLHRRGYRDYQHRASMRSTLAAALVHATGWDPTTRLVDPFCGSGTLPIEAAWAAMGVSPVHLRAASLRVHRLPRWRGRAPERGTRTWQADAPGPREWLVLSDHAPNHLAGARRNLDAAGLSKWARVDEGDVRDLTERVPSAGAVVTNPPYGIRSGEGDLGATYEALVEQSRAILEPGGRLGVLTARDDLVDRAAEAAGMRVERSLPLDHGRLRIRLMVVSG